LLPGFGAAAFAGIDPKTPRSSTTAIRSLEALNNIEEILNPVNKK
jgi:hypothetical protein